MAGISLDNKDVEILKKLQENSKISIKDLGRELKSPVTTVYAKIKRMEELGVIKNYKTVLDAKKLDRGTTAFILVSFAYTRPETTKTFSQRDIAKKICLFPEVQEVHILAGEWDILVKVKAKDIDAVGKFVVDRLRTVEGVEKTLTILVFDTQKETPDIFF